MEIDIAGKLFPNLATVVVQLCSTGVMLVIFKKYFWNVMKEFMEKRAEAIEGNILEAKQMNEQAKVFIQESEQQSRLSAKEYRDTIQKAKEDAIKVKDGILEEAAKEAKLKIEQAERMIEAEKLQAQDEMKKEIVEVAFEVASKVMNKEMNTDTNKEFVNEFLKDVVN